MKNTTLIFLIGLSLILAIPGSFAQKNVTLVTSTEKEPWVNQPKVEISKSTNDAEIIINTSKTQQTITGFGTCFNEQGWTSLNSLDSKDRKNIINELFAQGGANFTICRMPIGANDFSLNWYSYNETDGDFNMKNFSVNNDKKTLIPFIKSAKQVNANLKIWASPWCPPSWMKTNKSYASTCYSTIYDTYKMMNPGKNIAPGEVKFFSIGTTKMYIGSKYDSGLTSDQQGKEGVDMFIQQDKYLKAYALYFSKFIDAYKSQGIDIFAVMPQNEFNSPQVFPSCVWTGKGLSNFIGKYLGPVMKKKGVEIMLGTMERPKIESIDSILKDPLSSQYITGVGFQWAGKKALPLIREKYPQLTCFQTEQECGNGDNDWRNTKKSWDLMKHYLNNGVSVYDYWNTSLFKGGVSRWGWAQNSLVVVDSISKTYKYTSEYYLLKHVSHYVKQGAKKIETAGTNEDVLAFINPDKSIVVVMANLDAKDKQINIRIGNETYSPILKANSFSTFYVN
jgi:glucosylceramidase